MTRSAAFAVALALTVGASACSDDDGSASTTTPPVDTVETTTTVVVTAPTTTQGSALSTTSTSTSTTAATDPTTTLPSSVENTDWRQVIETLSRRSQDLFAAPDPSRVGEVCAPQSTCEADTVAQLSDFAGRGEHVEGAPPMVVLSADVVDTQPDPANPDPANPLVVSVRYTWLVQDAPDYRIVDSAGNTVIEVEQEAAPGSEITGLITLTRAGTADDPWRIMRTR